MIILTCINIRYFKCIKFIHISGAVYYCDDAGNYFNLYAILTNWTIYLDCSLTPKPIFHLSTPLTFVCLIFLDPCGLANSTEFFESYARFENCQHDAANRFCDRYIIPQWYRVNDAMLTQCPQLLSCGTIYPVWLNGNKVQV